MHSIGRMIPLTIFSALLLTSFNFPTNFECPLGNNKATTNTLENVTRPTKNYSFVDCTYLQGTRNKELFAGVTAFYFLIDAVIFGELVYLLWSAWKDSVFRTDQEFISVYILRKRTETIPQLNQMIRRSQNRHVFTECDGFRRKRKLEEIYINVLIQDGRESTYNSRRKFKGRHEIYDIQLEKSTNARSLNSTAELFQATNEDESHPRTVLAVGRPGIGKTLLTEKIFNEWQQEKMIEFWHGKIAHGLNRSSLCQFNNMTICEYIHQQPNNTILVFDGLDELQVDDECLTDEKTVNSSDEFAHIYKIVKQLVNDELLPGATVLITSRPTAEHVYQNFYFDREVEILGFNKEQIKQYVEFFCYNDMQKSSKMWNIIKDSPELLSFCYIPVNSYIVCLTLNESIDFGEQGKDKRNSNVPKTITEMYKRAIKILLYKHNSKYKNKQVPKDYLTAKLPEKLQKDLKELKEIAKDGMEKDKLVFEFQSSDKRKADLSDCGVLNQLHDENQFIFSFLHLTIQEFLAALQVVDHIKNVESFLEDHIDDPKWHLVIQFVAGLLGDKKRELRPTECEDSEIVKSICRRFQDWMPKIRRIDSVDKGLLVIKCVWEMQEDHVMELISSFACEDDDEEFSLRGLDIAPAESTALFNFLSHIRNLKKLQIYKCSMTNIAIRGLGEFLRNDSHTLKGNNCKLNELSVGYNSLTAEGAKCLSDALKSNNCKLTKLDVRGNDLKAGGAKYLSDALKSDNCKLTELDIRGNALTIKGAEYLSDALKSNNCKLSKLNLRDNDIEDDGAKYLSDAMTSDQCKLIELDVRGNTLTIKGAEYLSDALKSDNCKLTELDVSGNCLTAESAKSLSDALKSNNCKLTELDISNNDLTADGAQYLSGALKSDNCKLTVLYVSRNSLKAKGAKYLSDALKLYSCKLIELYISHNGLTAEGALYLGDALRSDNCKLAQLM
ncbi:NACHT, LRR and PYD domains-containing protein 3-like [Dendronephthya gigantea]|uniref:NACHT, LRR and PYD domains-containing protein 3-like n=1 Tax=Dendronephthya gigantea TaxID=151771 RepID=UPI00106AF3DE|nr:NACHT, LRR and PYD domains-containing protein 3-like [Dendronephthya gigantea]